MIMANTAPTTILRRHRRPSLIFLTGQPSVGKTTIVKNIINACIVQVPNSQHNPKNKVGKTSNHDDNGDTQISIKKNVRLSGFYTEEKREDIPGIDKQGQRIGFDLICFLDGKNNDGNDDCGHNYGVTIDGSISNERDNRRIVQVARAPLSRVTAKPKKGEPCVGKYLVDVENVDRFVVASLRQTAERLRRQSTQKDESRNDNDELFELCVLDEVGKMEMLCPTFIPAMHDVLDAISEYGYRNDKMNEKSPGGSPFGGSRCILLGTIPTPRYGRIIPDVEDIRSREDVMVLHVTKNNRDDLKNKLSSTVKTLVEGKDMETSTVNYWEELSEYIYVRQGPTRGKKSNKNEKKRKVEIEPYIM